MPLPGATSRLLPVLLGAAAWASLAAPAAAWGPQEPAPVLDSSIIQPPSQMMLREDDSALFLARGSDAGSDDVTQLVVRPPGGPAAFAAPFGSGFGQYVTTNLLLLSPLTAGGDVIAVRQASPYNAMFLAPGASPATAAIEAVPDRISQLDVAPSGEAAAILGGGSTASLSFRPKGPAGRFDTPRPLDRAGNMRSYGIGVTLDPDGGVLVVYRTEQAAAVLQAYAPPGEDFGAPELIDVPTGSQGASEPSYVQSTNGHGMLVWSENVTGDSNRDEVYVAARRPGGLLGEKSLVAKAAAGRLVTPSSAGITDSGAQYVGVLDAQPVSGCNPNTDLHRQGAIASRPFGGAWTLQRGPGTWPRTSSIGPIATSGDKVAVVTLLSDDVGQRCQATDPASSATVQLGTGTTLGGPVTIASEATADTSGNAVQIDGLAVNARGSAIALTDVPQGGNTWKRFIRFHAAPAGGSPSPQPPAPPGPPGPGPVQPGPPVAEPLPAPGAIRLSGKTLTARGGRIPFEASCTRIGPGDKVYCRIDAILIEAERRARGSAARKPKVLARAKRARVAPGKRGKVTLALTRLGKRKLGGKGLRSTLRVTIRKGGQVRQVQRKVTVKVKKRR